MVSGESEPVPQHDRAAHRGAGRRSIVDLPALVAGEFGWRACFGVKRAFSVRMNSGASKNSPQVLGVCPTRRQVLSGLGYLLASGLWPGSRAAAAARGDKEIAESIRFVVVTDIHHRNEECDPWVRELFRQVGRMKDSQLCFGLGDLADRGDLASLKSVHRFSDGLDMPFHASPGNHDLDQSPVDEFFSQVFPDQRNYVVRKRDWQFVCIDTTEGNKWNDVTISNETLAWLDEILQDLDPLMPTVLCTHFPLAAEVRMCPNNAEAVLARFVGHNLRGTFGGHFHGHTSHDRGGIRLRTSPCSSRVRGNHDGTPEKGYLVVEGDARGRLTTEFVQFAPPEPGATS